jgi:alginate O-acetyltransferase complex protein AlgI
VLFNSLDFAWFLPIVLLLYWFVTERHLKLQNALLLVSSYAFYGFWDWRFLTLIAFSSAVDFGVGCGFRKTDDRNRRRFLLGLSITTNLGLLGFFKYYNFFLDNFIESFRFFGKEIEAQGLSIVLPVGISFYTFQTLSYSIDTFKRKLEPTKDPIAFFAFVSFFPQLVAGPIERATNLLPQFYQARSFDRAKAVDGGRQILWGLFKKVVIADNCATIVNSIFESDATLSGSTLLLGAVLFAFQIYGDFSGYSDIAIGVARLFGFNLMRNFAFPYFSRDIAEFWRRWHISLSTWFRDYVYIPLGGSRGGPWNRIRNTFAIFLVSGFWHGANWTFLAWGALHALFFLPLLLMKKNRKNTDIVAAGRWLPSAKEALQVLSTFFLTTVAWVFFRAKTIGDAIDYLSGIFSPSLFTRPEIAPEQVLVWQLGFLLLVEWCMREKQHALQLNWDKIPQALRYSLYYGIALMIVLMGGREQEFIYFQF